MLNYDYGPLRFTFLGGLLMTALVPVAAIVVLGLLNLYLYDASTIGEGMRIGASELRDLYRDYPQWAFLAHALFFIKGFAYRRRYLSYSPLLVLALAIGAYAWFASGRSAAGLASLFMPSGADQATQALGAVSSGVSSSRPAVPAGPPNSPAPSPRANLLDHPAPENIPFALLSADHHGQFLVSGYLGDHAVIFVLNTKSSISASPLSMIDAASGACSSRASKMDGDYVIGCVATVRDAYIGSMHLPPLQFFFTNSLAADSTRVVLGANAIKHLAFSATPSGRAVFLKSSHQPKQGLGPVAPHPYP